MAIQRVEAKIMPKIFTAKFETKSKPFEMQNAESLSL